MIDKEKIVVAAVSAASANVNWLTSDRIQALTGGHGMLNLSVIPIANVLAEELLGEPISMSNLLMLNTSH